MPKGLTVEGFRLLIQRKRDRPRLMATELAHILERLHNDKASIRRQAAKECADLFIEAHKIYRMFFGSDPITAPPMPIGFSCSECVESAKSLGQWCIQVAHMNRASTCPERSTRPVSIRHAAKNWFYCDVRTLKKMLKNFKIKHRIVSERVFYFDLDEVISINPNNDQDADPTLFFPQDN